MPDSITRNYSRVLLKWLQSLSLPNEPQRIWGSRLFEAGLNIKGTWHNRRQWSDYFDSPLLTWLRHNAWLPTTKGLVRPSLAFISKQETSEVLGDTVPYFEGDLSELF